MCLHLKSPIMLRNILTSVFWVCILLGCNWDNPSTSTQPVVAATIELGSIAAPANVTVRDGGASATMNSHILWTFGDTIFNPASEDGTNLRSNTAALAPLDAPLQTNGQTDSNGAPFQAVPFTAEDQAYNDSTGNLTNGSPCGPVACIPKIVMCSPSCISCSLTMSH